MQRPGGSDLEVDALIQLPESEADDLNHRPHHRSVDLGRSGAQRRKAVARELRDERGLDSHDRRRAWSRIDADHLSDDFASRHAPEVVFPSTLQGNGHGQAARSNDGQRVPGFSLPINPLAGCVLSPPETRPEPGDGRMVQPRECGHLAKRSQTLRLGQHPRRPGIENIAFKSTTFRSVLGWWPSP